MSDEPQITVPAIGKKYEVIAGTYNGFIGECVSYDLTNDLPIILQDENWNSRAVRVNEIKLIRNNKSDISREQQS